MTTRLTEAELQNWKVGRPGTACLAIRVSDRYGDYGLVGFVLLRSRQQTLVIEGWALSCRALGRGVEERVIAYLGEFADRQGLTALAFLYRQTAKNQPVLDFFNLIGCTEQAFSSEERMFFLSAAAARECFLRAQQRWRKRTGHVATQATEPAKLTESPLSRANLSRIALELYDPKHISKAMLQGRTENLSAGTEVCLRTPTERKVGQIWAELLNIGTSGPDENFFAAGGDSILGVRLLSEIHRRFSVEIPLATFFEHEPTIGSLAAIIDEQEIAKHDRENLSHVPDEIRSLGDRQIESLLHDDPECP